MKIGILTLGCPRNTVDSEKLIALLKHRGFVITVPEKSDTLIINTCGFIEEAKKESIETIKEALQLKKEKKLKKVIVAGCLVKRYRTILIKHLKGIDALIGIMDSDSVQRIITTPEHLAYLKIAEGCSNCCSYCAIPLIKGPLKSRPANNILEEIEVLEKKGIKELNIIAQDTTAWGKDRYKKKDLNWLLKRIVKKTKNIEWIRLLYTHPRFITKELIETIASEPKICNYIDMPIQHINNRILKLMNRKVTKTQILKKIRLLRKLIPNIAIRTSIITGFPTEKKFEFKELLDFVKETEFTNLGAFIYSKEEDTKAYELKELPKRLKAKRHNSLMKNQQKISLKNNKKLVGREFNVIIDQTCKEFSLGRTYFQGYQIDTETIINKRLTKGRFYKVKITEAYEYDLVAEPIENTENRS
jgi:ribosomal protein S12 methylthiotransferase